MKIVNKTLVKFIVLIGLIISFSCSNKQSEANQSSNLCDTVIKNVHGETDNEDFEQTDNSTVQSNESYNSAGTIMYKGLTLEEAYSKFCKNYPEIAKHLPKQLTSDDKIYISNIDDENVEIIYRPLVDEDGLFIKLSYRNGVTTLDFKYANDDILIRISTDDN